VTSSALPALPEATQGPGASLPDLLRRLVRRPLAAISLAYLLAVVFLAVFASELPLQNPENIDLLHVLSTPSSAHWLGTDSIGRDVASRLVYGAQPALFGVLLAVVTAVVIAVPVGLAAAMSQRTDRIVAPVIDLVMSIPGIIILLMVLATFDQSMSAAMVALGVLTSPGLARVVRASALAVVEEPYIAAARVYGLGQVSIATRHVLPRIVGPILVNISLLASAALITETGINFLGLGVHPPSPSWGGMVADAATVMDEQPWLLAITGGVVALTVGAFILLGDGLRDTTTETWTGRAATASRRGIKRARSSATARAAGTAADPRVPGAKPQASLTEPADDSLPDPDALLSVRQLSVAFPSSSGDPLQVVQKVSFDLRRGESVGLLGESGCGKTVSGLAILGMLPDTAQIVEGQVLLHGRDVLSMSKADRRRLRGNTIAFVSQEPMVALDPMFTVGSQVSEAVRRHQRVSRREGRRRATELLDRVKIDDPARVMKLYPHEISGGMAQRIAIAIALAGQPDLLIADEPTTALDVTVQSEILSLLASLQRDTGMAVLLISHDWGVVGAVCDRSVVMYAGQVVERGPIEDILSHPLHPYSLGLLAADPHFAEPGSRLSTIPGSVPQPAEWPLSCHFSARCPYSSEDCTVAPVPLIEAADGRLTRCIHSERISQAAISHD
jgi:peptide/nickel transport system permease protein